MKKRIFALAVAVMMLASFATTASAAETQNPYELPYDVDSGEMFECSESLAVGDIRTRANSLYIRNKPGYIGYGELNITTPLQAGEYEVTAFVVDSPFSLRDFNTFHTHDTAYRFTLTVQ